VHGNDGNDYIDGGRAETARGTEATYGGLGNDTLVGGGPAYGNKGDDVLRSFYMEGGPGDDRLRGGTAGYTEAQGPVVADIGEGTASAPGEGTDRIDGATGLSGSDFDDTLTAGGTTARLSGRGGADVLTGGPAADSITGGAGDDTVHAGGGDDMLFDSAGEDEPSGNDLLDGDEGTDRITYSGAVPVEVDLALDRATGYGVDALPDVEDVEGTNAPDVLLGDDGPNYLYAGDGEDLLRGRGGDDLVVDRFDYNDGQTDRLFGDAGDDGLTGGGRRDEIDGGEGNDRMSHGETGSGGPGDDLFIGVWTDADGGDGTDTVTFQHMGAATVDLEAGTVSSTGAGGNVASIENVIGSPFGDTISGSEGPNVIEGARGDDVLDGRGGDDMLDGGGGGDRLDGGPGTDRCTAGEHVANCES
jgi:Ca2+-binding RTX toxin-like protein